MFYSGIALMFKTTVVILHTIIGVLVLSFPTTTFNQLLWVLNQKLSTVFI